MESKQENGDVYKLDKQTKEKLVKEHMGLVISISKKMCECYKCFSLSEDLIQEGVKALLKAIKNFNPKLGVKLSDYAFPWIKNAVLQLIKEEINKGAHIPRSLQDLAKTVKIVLKEFLSQQRKPTLHEISEKVGASIENVKEAVDFLSMSYVELNLEQEDEAAPWYKLSATTFADNYLDLQDSLKKLRTDWQELVHKYYWEGKTFGQIAKEMGVPENTLKVWHVRILEKLRNEEEKND